MESLQEVWKPVVGYESVYEVSDHGRVKSLARLIVHNNGRHRQVKARILKPSHHTYGYHQVELSSNGKTTTKSVHRLVAHAFIGEPTGPVTRHLDGNPTNNIPANLAWGSVRENAQDRILHGRNIELNKTHCPDGHKYDADNTYITPSTGSRGCRICRARGQAEFRRRRDAGGWIRVKTGRSHNAEKTHCKHGHEFDEANTRRDRHGKRSCRACCRVQDAERYQRKRQLALETHGPDYAL